MKRTNVQRQQKAFTLIELLTVVAIIAVLAAILFPVFARARENARRASCMSNLKQIGLGAMMYVQDYDERYPMTWNDKQVGEDRSWMGLLQPYTKNVQLFYCPSSSGNKTDLRDARLGPHYAANIGVFKTPYPDETRSDRANVMSLSTIQSPSTIYMLLDGPYYALDPQSAANTAKSQNSYLPGLGEAGGDCSAIPSSEQTKLSDCQTGRHLGGVNIAFADGHVKWLNSKSVREEALKCGTGKTNYGLTCGGETGNKSAWNPWIDNP